ncbi:MAG: 2-oxo acid dehydrogenase subunit E2 [Candidatus Eisenbacteria bacterium]|nr:2-oxo acid dehydrogenase subunit E2 [Candidatus Eisenbacteria bacterium]
MGGTFSISERRRLRRGELGARHQRVPEVAILGAHKIVDRPVVKNGQIVIAPMMNTVIGFDHRVIDGEMAVKFPRRVRAAREAPELLWFYA